MLYLKSPPKFTWTLQAGGLVDLLDEICLNFLLGDVFVHILICDIERLVWKRLISVDYVYT